MGAFYQTASPQSVDFAYKLPTELMLKAIEAGDAQNDMQVSQLDILNDAMAKVKMLDKDRVRAKEIIGGYQTQTDQFAADLYKSPQDWRKRMGDIRSLGRKLATDYTSGELSAIQGNYTDYMTWAKDEKTRMDKGEISPEFYEAARKKYLNDFKGTNYNNETGTYDKVTTAAIAKYVNIPERVDSYVKDIKANSKKVTQVQGKNMYLVSTTKGEKWVDEKEVKAIAMMKASADMQAQNYVKQGVSLGLFQSPESVWMPAINAAAMAQGFSESEYAEDVKGDPVKTMMYEQAQTTARQLQGQTHAEKMAEKQHTWKLEEEARGSLQKARETAIKEHNLNPASTIPIPESPYEGWSTGGGKIYTEGGSGATPEGPTPKEQAANAAALGIDLSGSYSITPDSSGVSPNLRAVAAGKAKPSGTSENYVNVFSPNELQPDVMRTQVIPMARQSLDDALAKYQDALKTGNPKMIAAANADVQASRSVLNAGQGILVNAQNRYFNSKEFTSLPAQTQSRVRGYMSYIYANNLQDNTASRKRYADAAGFQYETGLMYGVGNVAEFYGYGALGETKPFDNAVDKATKYLNKATKENAESNKYKMTGMDMDFSDPTIASILNTGFAGRTVIYNPHTFGGKDLTGKERGLENFQLDAGWNPLSGGKALTIPELMKAAGASSYGQLFEKGTVMSSNNGHIRMQFKLKDQGPNRRDIGGNASYSNQIEGLGPNREIIVEFQDDATNRAIMERMGNDPNPIIRGMSNVALNPDNNNLRSLYLNVPRSSPGAKEWTSGDFGYGNASFDVRKHSDGRSEVKVHFTDKGQPHTATFYHDNDAAAEEDISTFHEQYNNPKGDEWEGYLRALRTGGFLDK